jgi:Mg2+ and Co2+ transporter CorA
METSLLRSDVSKKENEREKSLASLELKARSELDKYKLPSNRQVLERFFRLQLDHSKTTPKKKIAEKLYLEIMPFYKKIPCPTKTKINCIKKILNLHEEFRNAQKNVSNYKTDIPDTAYYVFANTLEKLFDLSAPDAEEQIKKDPFRTIDEKIQDIDFLRDQKNDRISKFWVDESLNYKKKVAAKLKLMEREIAHENNQQSKANINSSITRA